VSAGRKKDTVLDTGNGRHYVEYQRMEIRNVRKDGGVSVARRSLWTLAFIVTTALFTTAPPAAASGAAKPLTNTCPPSACGAYTITYGLYPGVGNQVSTETFVGTLPEATYSFTWTIYYDVKSTSSVTLETSKLGTATVSGGVYDEYGPIWYYNQSASQYYDYTGYACLVADSRTFNPNWNLDVSISPSEPAVVDQYFYVNACDVDGQPDSSTETSQNQFVIYPQ